MSAFSEFADAMAAPKSGATPGAAPDLNKVAILGGGDDAPSFADVSSPAPLKTDRPSDFWVLAGVCLVMQPDS